jgi:hypothetical protein
LVFIQYSTLGGGALASYRELPLVFAFLLATFWVHAPIARLFGAGRPPRSRPCWKGCDRCWSAWFFWVVFFSLPQHYLVPTAEVTPKSLRFSLAVSAR